MRADTTFSNKKLSEKEFAEKYWLNGEMPYQYHTGTIEDGRDEREQFIFNNVRALWNLKNEKGRWDSENHFRNFEKIRKLEKSNKKIKIILGLMLFFQVCVVAIILMF